MLNSSSCVRACGFNLKKEKRKKKTWEMWGEPPVAFPFAALARAVREGIGVGHWSSAGSY